MTDTGQVPGEGHPDNAGMVDQQGFPAPVQEPAPTQPQAPAPIPAMPAQASAPAGYAFQDLVDNPAEPEDEELLLMPSGQGAWSDPQVVPPVPAFPMEPVYTEYPETPAAYAEPVYPGFAEPAQFAQPGFPEAAQPGFPDAAYSTGAHEAGGRDSGALDLGGLISPQPVAGIPVTPARRPLHMGPPMPEAGGVVRSLADRGPAAAPAAPVAPGAPVVAAGEPNTPATPVPMSGPGPQTTGPEYLDVPGAEAAVSPAAPQLGEIPPQAGAPWAAEPAVPVAAPEVEAVAAEAAVAAAPE
ncbi:5,6-dimethylbenzimidazole synthase, partial [Streptomyces sp. ISL-86]|nr:5,6-dimethylbenzimidazole synthase [Streptomyces sp. ISL-86]